ncbi:uncharacterized protein LOC119562717 [Drosophila subpulchrella]|uniref:uncharacterized protein LOC119562717 n=1 Tax=Drosophila subpulchrella TaxID=1486046 RepID=UPI0018A1B5AA|nr:uncharacterized protein LOC119562717 [Drosophila subpulchrella]
MNGCGESIPIKKTIGKEVAERLFTLMDILPGVSSQRKTITNTISDELSIGELLDSTSISYLAAKTELEGPLSSVGWSRKRTPAAASAEQPRSQPGSHSHKAHMAYW